LLGVKFEHTHLLVSVYFIAWWASALAPSRMNFQLTFFHKKIKAKWADIQNLTMILFW